MLSQHAVVRMQQRGIQQHDVEVLLQYGRTVFHRGRDMVSFDRQSWQALLDSQVVSPSCCDRLRNQYLVVDGSEIVTVAHRTRHFKRDRQ